MKYVAIIILTLGLIAIPVVALTVGSKSTPQLASIVSLDESKYQCNRYGDPKSNFEILSICAKGTADTQGQTLSASADNIKSWLLTRWSFPNEDFAIKCKIILTPNREVFKELFGKDAPQNRIARNASGQATELTVWLTTDDPRWRTSTLSGILTEICLQEVETKYGKVGYWLHRGMPIVNGDLPTFRQKMGNLYLIFQNDIGVYWSKDLLTMTPDTLAKHPTTSSVWFDSESAALLHMLFKEKGPRKFNNFLAQCRIGDPELALKTVYGYNSYAECDAAFKQYMLQLSTDITGRGKVITPNSHLTFPIPR